MLYISHQTHQLQELLLYTSVYVCLRIYTLDIRNSAFHIQHVNKRALVQGKLFNMTRALGNKKCVPNGNRTCDLLNSGQALYPLSYENSCLIMYKQRLASITPLEIIMTIKYQSSREVYFLFFFPQELC